MYICICNAIKEKDLRSAAHAHGGDAEAVYAALGKRPNCGQCLEEADDILFEERLAAAARKFPVLARPELAAS